MKPHLCKKCGENKQEEFRPYNKSKCKKCLLDYNKSYKEDNKKDLKIKNRNYYSNNKEKVLSKNKKWFSDNPEYRKQYYIDNKDSKISYTVNYLKNKRQEDPSYKFISNLRSRHYKVFKGLMSTTEELGCDTEELRRHLESQFVEGMSFDNYGEKEGQWSIDHREPLSSVELNENGYPDVNSEHNKKLMHYTNMQPMWHIDNLKKSNNKLCQTKDKQEDQQSY